MKRKPNPNRDKAVARVKALAPLLKELAPLSAGAIARELNRRGIPTPTTGSIWHPATVIRIKNRLKGARR